MLPYILGIESSCDDTSAAVMQGDILLSNVIAGQDVHREYGGVVPEYASRAHQQNIVPVVAMALQKAKIDKKQLHAIAYTRGPGLLGSLMVGSSFARSMALGLNIPLIAVDHLDAHILSHFIREPEEDKAVPEFPFLCLTVSGGHTQITRMEAPFSGEIIGRTIDDAAGEAFDKAAKILGLPYPGGVLIDRYAKSGNPLAYRFSEPSVPGLDFSFSGLKTSFLYFLRDHLKTTPGFIDEHLADLCASIQSSIVNMLMVKIIMAVKQSGISTVALAGGVSANSALRAALTSEGGARGWKVFLPKPAYCTDNAAMIAVAGWFSYSEGRFGSQEQAPYARGNQIQAEP